MNMKQNLLKEWDKLTAEHHNIILGGEGEENFKAGQIIAIENLLSSCYDIHKEFFKECEGYDDITGWRDEG